MHSSILVIRREPWEGSEIQHVLIRERHWNAVLSVCFKNPCSVQLVWQLVCKCASNKGFPHLSEVERCFCAGNFPQPTKGCSSWKHFCSKALTWVIRVDPLESTNICATNPGILLGTAAAEIFQRGPQWLTHISYLLVKWVTHVLDMLTDWLLCIKKPKRYITPLINVLVWGRESVS